MNPQKPTYSLVCTVEFTGLTGEKTVITREKILNFSSPKKVAQEATAHYLGRIGPSLRGVAVSITEDGQDMAYACVKFGPGLEITYFLGNASANTTTDLSPKEMNEFRDAFSKGVF